jgi:hypothetical protein
MSGQTLMTLRCYFDDDTNPMQTISLGGQMSVDAPFTVNVSGLSQGVHTLYIEVLNFDGKWSHFATKQVQIIGSLQMATLNMVEYYFDDEPANASAITVAVSGTSVDQTFDVSVDGLTNGPHVLFVRTRDSGGAWSLPVYRVIQVYGSTYEQITEAEYFWNTDPGFGNGTSIALSAFVVEDDFEISAAGLPNGVHLLYIRVKDANGLWSLSKEHVVQVGSQGNVPALLVLGEYFLDDDPGEGQGTPIPMGPALLVDDQFDLTMPAVLAAGPHWLYVRVMNEFGYWSEPVGRQINVCSITIPNVSITGATCSGGTAVLTAPVGYNSYTWSTQQTGNTINVTSAGTYYLTVTDSDCSTTVPVEVVFEDSEIPDLLVTGSMCPGGAQTISVDGSYSTYAWTGGATSSTLNVTTPGTYSVTLNAGTCPVTASVEVSYSEVPNLQLSVSGPTCTGATQTLSVVNDVFTDYEWANGPMTSTYNVTAAGQYTLQAEFDGCAVSQTIDVVFTDLVAPQITLTGNPCQDASLQLSVPNGYSAYTWSSGSNVASSTVTASGDYTVTVFQGTCSAQSTIEVNFGSLVVEPIEIIGSGCPGTIFTLTAGTGYDSYSWSPSGNTTLFVNTTTEGEYTLTVTDGDCEGSVTATVEYLDVPDLEVTVSGDLCPDGLITLDAGPFYDSYFWTPGNATTSFLNVTTSGTYTVDVTSGNCDQTNSTSINFIVLPVPVIEQTQNMLTCNSSGYAYQWYFNGVAISGATNQFYNATQTGNYTVEIIADDCNSTSANYFFQYISVIAVDAAPILIYPNPARDVLNVQGMNDCNGYQIYDLTGRLVMEGKTQSQIPLQGLSNGLYTIQFQHTDRFTVFRFEKMQ